MIGIKTDQAAPPPSHFWCMAGYSLHQINDNVAICGPSCRFDTGHKFDNISGKIVLAGTIHEIPS
jgi:hypothetical protein